MDDDLRNRRITPETNEELDNAALARFYGQHMYTRDTLHRKRAPLFEALRPNAWYVCQLCTVARAEWPREQKHTFRFPFGYSWTVAYITPMVCSTCRIMHQPEVTRLGDGRRRFWKRMISLWLNEPYPSAGPKMLRAFTYRQILWIIACAFVNIGRMIRDDVCSGWRNRCG